MSDLRWPKGGTGPDPTEAALNDLGGRQTRQADFGNAWQASDTDPIVFLESLFTAADLTLGEHARRWLQAHAAESSLVMAAFGRVAQLGDLLLVAVVTEVDDYGSWVGVSGGGGIVRLLIKSDPSVED